MGRVTGRMAWTAALAAALALAGCAGSISRERGWVGNPLALASTVAAPAMGSADVRSYVAPGLEGKSLGTVRLLPVTVTSTRPGDPETDAMMKRVELSVAEGLFRAVTGSDRFERLAGEGETAACEAKAEAIVHLAVLNGRVRPDPFQNDPASKLIVIYTVTQTATGRVAAKFTAVHSSWWEHTDGARADLEKKGVALGQEFFLFLTGM